MKKYLFILVITAGIFSITHAGDKYSTYYGEFRPGQIVHSFGDKVNIRKKPETGAAVMDQLQISAPVKIIEKTDKVLEMNGFKDYWYKVEYLCSCGHKYDQGYVWGGLLSKAFVIIQSKDDYPQMSLLFGIVRQSDARNIFEARYVEYNKIKYKVEFEGLDFPQSPFFTYSTWAEGLSPQILSPGVEVFLIHFEYEADEYPMGDVMLLKTAQGLSVGMNAIRSFSEFGSSDFRYIWPGMKGGKKKTLILERTIEEQISEDNPERKVTKTLESFSWDGKKLSKISQ